MQLDHDPKTKQLLEDLLAFTLYTYRGEDRTPQQRLNRIVDAISHDLNCVLNADPHFVPWVTGFAAASLHVPPPFVTTSL